MKFCERPFVFAYLADKGEVWPCGWMHYTIGNLYQQDLDEIWHSKAAQEARETILNGSFAFCRKTSCPFCERDELPDISEEEISKLAVPSETPLIINMANDHICNIACTNCRTSIYRSSETEREKIDEALNRLIPFANRAEMINMNGGGEFLANPSFIRFLEKLRPEKSNFDIHFETNGVLFDENHWKRFAHLGQYHIEVIVTINSLKRETYRYLSGGFDHLNQVQENLRFLSGLRRKNVINKLAVTMVVQECNFWEVPEYIHTFSDSQEFEVDEILMKPLYKWWHMAEETYWFKNILNPLHPYHKEYLKILDDDCWKNPKVYDWGCHNIREPKMHPLSQEKIYNRLLLDICQNKEGLSAVDYMKSCIERIKGRRVGYFGKNEFSQAIVTLLRDAGIEIVLQLTWAEDAPGDIPKVSKQNFRPEMVDVMLLIDFHKGGYWFEDLPALGFDGPILTIEEFMEGKRE